MAIPTVEASANGHAAAAIDWQAVLVSHERWLRMIVGARVGEAQAVDEVMQEIALAAVRQSAPLQDAAKVAPWLYQLAVRQALLYRRKMGRARKLTHRYAERQDSASQTEGDPLGWLLRDERRAMVRMALHRLPRRDAEILMFKYSEGWSYAKIAETLDVSCSAVEARLHRARGRLRKELAALDVASTEA
ncbi:MAG: sigma-70 family RNA polymerase sigma factor [Pirellulales bacterium]|nr:sigma-70 family RNA polymerase sigma factor [Pirellulales bacterium]